MEPVNNPVEKDVFYYSKQGVQARPRHRHLSHFHKNEASIGGKGRPFFF